MVAAESAAARAAVTELAAQPPETMLSLFERVPTLFMPRREPVSLADVDPRQLHKVLLKTYERAPEDLRDRARAPRGWGRRRCAPWR